MHHTFIHAIGSIVRTWACDTEKKGRKRKTATTTTKILAIRKGERRKKKKQHRNRKLNQTRNGRWFNKLQCVFRAPLLIQFSEVKSSFYYWINQSQAHRFRFDAVQIKNDWAEAEKISAKIMLHFICSFTGRSKQKYFPLHDIDAIDISERCCGSLVHHLQQYCWPIRYGARSHHQLRSEKST